MQRGLYMNCAMADSYLVRVSVAVSGVADSWQRDSCIAGCSNWHAVSDRTTAHRLYAADVQDVSATSSIDPILKSTNADDVEDMPLARELSLREQMEQVMKDSLSSVTCGVQGHLTDVRKTITNAIKGEMQLHTSTSNRGTWLEKVHAYLMSATSVEAERAFSAAGVLCTKLLSQLADNSMWHDVFSALILHETSYL